jgi:hypothetical protein
LGFLEIKIWYQIKVGTPLNWIFGVWTKLYSYVSALDLVL